MAESLGRAAKMSILSTRGAGAQPAIMQRLSSRLAGNTFSCLPIRSGLTVGVAGGAQHMNLSFGNTPHE